MPSGLPGTGRSGEQGLDNSKIALVLGNEGLSFILKAMGQSTNKRQKHKTQREQGAVPVL